MVERLVANEKVEGSTPFARSKKMNDLLNKKCEPCEGGIVALNLQEIHNNSYSEVMLAGLNQGLKGENMPGLKSEIEIHKLLQKINHAET